MKVMLKKIGHIILSCLLLVTTMGMAVSKHYCGGELISVSVFDEADNCCDMDGCCENETQVFQVKEDFSVPAVFTVPALAGFEILGHILFAGIGLTAPETETYASVFDESPPVLPTQKTLALKQVYLL